MGFNSGFKGLNINSTQNNTINNFGWEVFCDSKPKSGQTKIND